MASCCGFWKYWMASVFFAHGWKLWPALRPKTIYTAQAHACPCKSPCKPTQAHAICLQPDGVPLRTN